NYENGGNWYVILDEAHKGAKKESKLQLFYSILSRNGFLFNFSATFTDDEDKVTTAFNFNLKEFVSNGYGKHIYLSQQDISAFKDKDIYDKLEKQKVVLKSLVLLTYIKKTDQYIKSFKEGIYHEPILLTLVNSVNNKLSKNSDFAPDLILFFREIEKIAKSEYNIELLEVIKSELRKEFSKSNSSVFMFENGKVELKGDIIDSITIEDILFHIFNSKTRGGIEVIQIKDNIHEAILKLKTTNIPFALIKIGNAVKWIKDNLNGYEITRTYEYRSVFDEIERRDEFTVLMGSRAFYEGWDSNRPNIILYINIGVGTNSRKFVLQSIGRGVRIEPIKDKRKRLISLADSHEDEGLREVFSVDQLIPLETLFVFGTKKKNLREILHTLNVRKEFDAFKHKVNEKDMEDILKIPDKIKIDIEILKMMKRYFDEIDERIILMENNLEPAILYHIKKSVEDKNNDYIIDKSGSIKPSLSMVKREIGRLATFFKSFNEIT
ncbi:MAG: restriction endonuclease subunit R, partial [Promethearchaeota archaeon]